MLERVVSGLMAFWMAIFPAQSNAVEADGAPEAMSVQIQADSARTEEPFFPGVVTLDDVRAVTFADSPSDASDAISYVAALGLMSGFEDGLFCPDRFLNLGQAVRILRRISAQTGLDSGPESSSDFEWASAVELLSIQEDGFQMTFRPALVEYADGAETHVTYQEDTVEMLSEYDDGAMERVSLRGESSLTRAQFALLLYRFAAFAGYDLSCTGNLNLRPDVDSLPAYARIPYSWGMEHDIFRTIVEDGLCPNLPVSRAQAALLFTALIADGIGEPIAVRITADAQKPFFQSVSRSNHGPLQDAINAAAQRYGAVSLQVAVIERGRLADTYAYGWATKNTDRMTAAHKMRIASISKVLVGLAAARMRQDGLISYKEPLGTYWDATFRNPAHPNTPITLQTLLTHTSSLADGGLTGGNVRSRLASGRGYTSALPGSLDNWEYSNYGFGVLGLTLERVADRTLDQLLDRYFFDLMGIDAAFYAGDLRDASQLVTLYSGGSVTRSVEAQRSRHSSGVPCSDGSVFAGGLVISVRDLGKIAALLANDGVYEGLRLLDADAVRIMETYDDSRTVQDGFYQAMPIRYRTDAYGREGIYYHTGSAYGVFNGFSYDPATGDGVVVLTVGASGARDGNGNYAVCGAIFDTVYHAIAS